MKIKIRKLRNGDIPHIIRMVREHWAGLTMREIKRDYWGASEGFYEKWGNFVAEAGKKCVGVIGYYRLPHQSENIVWMDWFIVDKGWRRQGVGSKLLKHLLRYLKKEGVKILCVEHSNRDKVAYKFYKEHDFKERGRIPDYWEDDTSLIILTKNI